MNKITIPIKGMHCRSCEILVEKNLKNIPGINRAEVNYKAGKADIFYDRGLPASESIKKAVKDAGYDVGRKEATTWLSRDKSDYINLLKGAGILLVVYLIAKWLGLFSFGVNTDSTNVLIVLVVGLVAGISTCMALVGGLVLGLSARHAEKHPEISARQKFVPHLYFNLGRIIGFGVLGGVIGMLGSIVRPSLGTLGFMTIAVGGVMIFLGLKLVEIFPALKDKSISLPKSIANFFGLNKEQKEYSHKGSFVTGALTFFLPCGFTQAMQLYAVSTGSFSRGFLVMSLFALGTAPGLLGVGGLASVFKGKKAKIFFAATGLAVILLGWFNIANGSQLVFKGKVSGSASTAVDSTDVQEVRMVQDGSGYSPNEFTVEKGKKVKWIITSTNQFSCASSIVMPKYGINKYLKKGENIIEFVPVEVGQIPFSCSMGMYRGVFNVVESGNSALNSAPKQNVAALPSGGGCGGGGGGCGCGGGAPKKSLDTTPTVADENLNSEQLIKTQYTLSEDIVPNRFVVKKGIPVRFEIDVKENGQGCMSSIMVPDLYNDPQYLEGGTKIVMTFTPDEEGDYDITCAMGMPRGIITVTN